MSIPFNPRIAELVKDLRTATRFNAYQFLHEAADVIEAFQREVVRISNSSRMGLATSPATNSEAAFAPVVASEQPGASTPPRGASGANSTCSASLCLERLKALLAYDPDTGIFTWREGKRVGHAAGSKNSHGYVLIRIDGRMYRAHRLAFFYVSGQWPEQDIDHVNLNRTDNRLGNLRQATKAENNQNRRRQSNCQSGRRGVYWQRAARKWHSSIQHNNQRIFLGLFDSIDDATAIWDAEAKKLHGAFARTNNSSGDAR